MRKVLALLMIYVATSCAISQKNQMAVIHTEFGDMKVILYNETPRHRDNFIKLVKEHYYDSLLFHRVIKDFMIQGGDPESRHAAPSTMLGNGGPAYTIPAEFVFPKYFHKKGALAAARQGDQTNPDKASSGSQFYIVQGTVLSDDELKQIEGGLTNQKRQDAGNVVFKPYIDSLKYYDTMRDSVRFMNLYQKAAAAANKAAMEATPFKLPEELISVYKTIGGTPFLDNNYTVFGEVVEGLDVIDKIAAAEGDGNNRPLKDIRMSIELVK